MISLLALLALHHQNSPKLDPLEFAFDHPAPAARPWVYWFWNNANVTRVGIRADLEAMKRAGVGGVIIMDVVERFAPPRGTAEFMNPEWQSLFKYSVEEARRLGIEINMTNGPGWCGSSGPWITPALSMQKLVSSSQTVQGPVSLDQVLPRPHEKERPRVVFDSSVRTDDYYADVALLAYPVTQDGTVSKASIIDLSHQLDANGHLHWDVPAGKWVLQRIGHMSTGSSTRPPVVGGNGLECDKLSREAFDVHFNALLGKLLSQLGSDASKALAATHIDSWEVGGQDWTPKFREEFQRRRGYDPIPYLPNIVSDTGNWIIESAAMKERFKWDFQQTVSELLAENYSGRLAELAHQHGMRFTMEGYNLPIGDEATYTARADEPMTEFWTGGVGLETAGKAQEMASVAHIYGHPIVGAEAFTSGDQEMWKLHPALIKSLGDYEFSQGVNRFVIHRYAHQPYLDKVPGATMGPWGLHYERTQTWWEMSTAWHTYLARCQGMLREGHYVADICYLRPENPTQTYFMPVPAPPAGYRYDECSAEALLTRVTVRNHRLVLPDGMSYRVLVIPPAATMTPKLATKILDLLKQGANIVLNGEAPQASPSLSGFPSCDQQVRDLTAKIWHPSSVSGKVYHGVPFLQVLQTVAGRADLESSSPLNWIHRQTAEADIYFVANPSSASKEASVKFRATGQVPERWNPVTGKREPIALRHVGAGYTSIPLRLEPSESAFIVFRKSKVARPSYPTIRRNGVSIVSNGPATPIHVVSASYGVPGDNVRRRDVTAKVQKWLDEGTTDFQVGDLARGDDPAYGVVKTIDIQYEVAGKRLTASGQDPDPLSFARFQSVPERPAEVVGDRLVAWKAGKFDLIKATGERKRIAVPSVSPEFDLNHGWTMHFPTGKTWKPDGLPSLTTSPTPEVKFFSGTATYRTEFDFKPSLKNRQFVLDLGQVEVMAHVFVNDHDLGILWNGPYHVDVTSALRQGKNRVRIDVVNLWPNRLIGDSALPPAQRTTWSSFEPFRPGMPLLPSGILGPVKLKTAEVVRL